MANTDTQLDAFISYNSVDHELVEQIARGLEERGLRVFLDRWYLVPGRSWPDALEQLLDHCRAVIVALGPNGMGPWQQREHYLALNKQARAPTFSVIPLILPGADAALGFLSLNTWVSFEEPLQRDRQLDVLAAAVRGEPPRELLESAQRARASVCPYRGLEVFREEDAPFFFGRDAFVEKLENAVSRSSLVAVVGASGSGKSSVVRAGLVPALRRSARPVWDFITMVPGDRPLSALAGQLVQLLEPASSEVDKLIEANKLAEALREGALASRELVQRILDKQPGTDRLLLIVDQWEELYTVTAAAQEARAFIDLLLASPERAPLSVVLTLRADFYARALGHRELSDRIQEGLVNLGPMTADELSETISGPAEKVGLEFEVGLAERLLADVGSEPGNLPLLEFALKELWLGRQGNRLRHQVYEAMGRIQGAIAQSAEKQFAALGKAEQAAMQRLFTHLVRPGRETGDTRRRGSLDELTPAERELARRLARADVRLLVLGQDPGRVEVTVEVAHEALIREWDRLRGWIQKIRKQLEDRALLEDLALDWERRKRSWINGLSTGSRLRAFRRLTGKSRLQRDYVRASTRFAVARAFLVLCMFGVVAAYLVWSDRSGLGVRKTAELVAYRAGLLQPAWIPDVVAIRPGEPIGATTVDFPLRFSIADDRLWQSGEDGHWITMEHAFGFGRTEVTFEQFCASSLRPCPDDRGWGRGRRPVINVSWNDAVDYLRWLSGLTGKRFRLPTVAEWEYIAQLDAPDGKRFAEVGGDQFSYMDRFNNYADADHEFANTKTAPAGSFPPNSLGIFELRGNVWEWVQDCYADDLSLLPTNGTAYEPDGCIWRQMRGGAWNSNVSYLYSERGRRDDDATARFNDVGFRVVLELEQ